MKRHRRTGCGARGSRRWPVAVVVVTVLLAAACSSSGSSGATTATTTTSVPAGATHTTRPAATTTTTTSAPTTPSGVAEDAFLAGYPLLVTERTIQTFAHLVGVNRLFRTKALATDQSRFIVGPNHDTLYDIAVIDLRDGPVALTVPRISPRYYTFQFIDAWMDTIGYVGTRATDAEAGTWLVVPPGYAGTIPSGDHRIDSPTEQLFMLGRVRAVDGPDVALAYAATAGVSVKPLGDLTGDQTKPLPVPIPVIAPAPGTPQTVGSNGAGFFDELGDALAIDPPPTPALQRVFAAARSLGIGPGRHPSVSGSASVKAVLTAAVVAGNATVANEGGVAGRVVNGWQVNLDLGDPTKPLSLRDKAVVARHFWGPNVAAEAVYPAAVTASDGRPLNGKRSYVIHLAGNNLPPVKAFWSFTVYGPDSFLVANPINRFSISGQTAGVVRGSGGSIDVYLSHTAPPGHASNWLPTPDGPFRLVLRLYLPGPAILDGTYQYPPVVVSP